MNDPNKTQMGAPPTLDPNRTMMGAAPSLNATQTIKPVQCPVCKTFNPVGVAWCVDCGLIFELALDGDAFGAPAVQLPVLVDASGREHQLRPGANVLGRQGDVTVDDTRTSRKHAQVSVGPDGLWVEDLGSTNGTKLNGVPLSSGERRPLSHGDTVSLGGYELALSLPGETNKTVSALSGRTAAISAPPTTSDAVAFLVLPEGERPLLPGTYTFGRKQENDFVVSDPYVSGRHGEIEVGEDDVYLTDTGSTNGTLLNDAKLNPGQRVRLQASDVVKLGSVEVRVRYRS